MRDLVIIGGGTASQAAAMYAMGRQIDFLLICDSLGGSTVQDFERQLSRQPESLLNDRVTGVQRVGQQFVVETQRSGPIMAGAIIVAPGAAADLGFEPAAALVGHLVQTGPEGFIKVDRGFATAVPGLYAAGDVTGLVGEQVLAAIGDGARAARSAHFYLLTRPMARAVGQGR